MKKYESGICANCGADYGLHQSLSNCCPRFGREESNPNKPQQWVSTVFEDSGMKALHDSAPDLLEALEECYKLLPAFKTVLGQPSDNTEAQQAYQKAKAAISTARGFKTQK